MEPNLEIRRLFEVMPASGRMTVKIVSKPEQTQVIETDFPLPWNQERLIYINFDLWGRLSKPQRDLLILQKVAWLTGITWFKPDVYQGVVLAGILGGLVESAQSDIVGVAIAGGLSAIALLRIWRSNKSQDAELNADNAAIKVAQRRGYTQAEAAGHLLSTIEAVAKIEGRSSLDFIALIRCQNLRAIAGLSPVGVPDNFQ